jgi:hypothetical protein
MDVGYPGNRAPSDGISGTGTADQADALAFPARIRACEPTLLKQTGFDDFVHQFVCGLFFILLGGKIPAKPDIERVGFGMIVQTASPLTLNDEILVGCLQVSYQLAD